MPYMLPGVACHSKLSLKFNLQISSIIPPNSITGAVEDHWCAEMAYFSIKDRPETMQKKKKSTVSPVLLQSSTDRRKVSPE